MHDRNLSVHHVVAGVLWALAGCLIVLGILVRVPGVGHLGLMCAGMAMVANIRGFFCRASEREKRLIEVFIERTTGADVRSLR